MFSIFSTLRLILSVGNSPGLSLTCSSKGSIWFDDLFDDVWIYLNGNSIDFRSENDDVVDVVVAVDVDDLVGGAGNDNILGLVFKLLLLLLLKVCLSSFITISLHIGHS